MKKVIVSVIAALTLTAAVANAEYRAPVSYNTIGNYTYGSDGSSMNRIGNYTYGTDGNGNNFSCQTIGSYTYCN